MARLAPALVTLRSQINATYPNRDKSSDGWIGDSAHSSRVSDHNPDSAGIVHAIDVDKDGIDVYALLNAAISDYRTNYVIYAGVIYSRGYGFRARKYTGSNKHDKHMHISILHGSTASQTGVWKLKGAVAAPAVVVPEIVLVSNPTKAPSDLLRRGSKGPDVLFWQGQLWRMGIGVGPHDADFGPATEEGTRAFQRAAGIADDGVVGAGTRAAAAKVAGYPKAPGPALPVCGPGQPASTVQAFQARLRDRGWKIAVDGRHGVQTADVIRKFQRQVGLAADGIGGGQTWVALWTRPIT